MENQNPNGSSPVPARQDLGVLWTLPQVAQYLLVSRKTLYGWLKAGKVFDPAKIIRIGRSIRIPRSEVERIAGNVKTNLKNNHE